MVGVQLNTHNVVEVHPGLVVELPSLLVLHASLLNRLVPLGSDSLQEKLSTMSQVPQAEIASHPR